MTTSPGPHSGDGTSGLIDDALATLAERHGARLGDDLTAITLIATLTGQAERCLRELVHNARAYGRLASDRQALATSPDQARFRFEPRITGRRQQVAIRPASPALQPAAQADSLPASARQPVPSSARQLVRRH